MTTDELIRIAARGALPRLEVEAAARASGLTISGWYDLFALDLALGYLKGAYDFALADRAINSLFAFACCSESDCLQGVAWDVFQAFDAGEFIHVDAQGYPEQGEALTRRYLSMIPELEVR